MRNANECQWDQAGGCCKRDRLPGERFCPTHRMAMLRLMRASGYLQAVPSRVIRKPHKCEDVKETKFGVDE